MEFYWNTGLLIVCGIFRPLKAESSGCDKDRMHGLQSLNYVPPRPL